MTLAPARIALAVLICLAAGAPAASASGWGSLPAGPFADGPVSWVQRFGGVGSAAGDLNVAGGLAFDPATGNIYVADNDNERIDELDASGGFIRAWGAGVADGSSTSYQTCTTSCRQGVESGAAGALDRPAAPPSRRATRRAR